MRARQNGTMHGSQIEAVYLMNHDAVSLDAIKFILPHNRCTYNRFKYDLICFIEHL